MDKNKLTQYDTEFQRLMVERYAEDIPESGPDSYERINDFLGLMEAVEQYEVEAEMMEYAEKHPEATVRELNVYFHSFVPNGLPPCAEFWGDEENRLMVRYTGETEAPHITQGKIYKTVDIEEGWYRIKDDIGSMNDLYPPELFEIVRRGWDDEE